MLLYDVVFLFVLLLTFLFVFALELLLVFALELEFEFALEFLVDVLFPTTSVGFICWISSALTENVSPVITANTIANVNIIFLDFKFFINNSPFSLVFIIFNFLLFYTTIFKKNQ